MGRVKEQLLEEDWVEDEQQRIIAKRHTVISITYADLFNYDDINNCKGVSFMTTDGTMHICTSDDILELHGLHIKYQRDENVVVVVPLDKVVYVNYVQ